MAALLAWIPVNFLTSAPRTGKELKALLQDLPIQDDTCRHDYGGGSGGERHVITYSMQAIYQAIYHAT